MQPIKYLIVLSLLFITPAWATEPADTGTVLSLSATAALTVENDQLLVSFRIEAEGPDAAKLQKVVNDTTRKVQALLAQHPDIQVQTTGRSLQALTHYDKATSQQVRDGWRLVQNEQAITHSLASVPEWVDDIERAGAHLNGLNFNVSEKKTEATLEKLRMQAVQTFRMRAASMSKALDAPSFRILRLRTDNRMPPSPVMQRNLMAMSPAESAPSFNAGESRLSVTVSGDILLPEKNFTVR